MSNDHFSHMSDGKLLISFTEAFKTRGGAVNDPVIRAYMDELIVRNLAEEMSIVMGTNI